jgi:hypothetical protein
LFASPHHAAFPHGIKFLDRVREQGQDCRWIELVAVPTPADDGRPRSIDKLLIPEDALLHETNPCRSAIRVWHQYGQDPASRAMLHRLDEVATVEFQRGRLERAAVYEGQHKAGYNSTISEYRFDYIVECRVKLHNDLPCAFAGAKMKWIWSAVKGDGTVEETKERWSEDYVLQDFGDGAKSAIPDCN